MSRSFLSVVRAVMNYVGALDPQYSVSFYEARMKGIDDDMTPSRYLQEQSR